MRDTFPDWRGQTVLVLGAGPSARMVAEMVPPGAVRAIAVNRSFELVPWAECLYAADSGFWSTYPAARRFDGWKFCADPHVRYIDANVYPVTISRDPRTGVRSSDMIRGPVGTIGGAGNSGFQAVNLAVQFGASKILLCLDYRGKHWHGDHPRSLRNPSDKQLGQWAGLLDRQASRLASWGIEVLNIAPQSALKAFKYGDGRLFDSDKCSLQA